MLAANEYLHGTALWRHRMGDLWVCVKTSDGLRFLVGQPPGKAQLELTRKGFRYEWI